MNLSGCLCGRSKLADQGFTLPELLIAMALGVSLGAAVIHHYLGQLRVQRMHDQLQAVQQASAYARFLLTDALQTALADSCSTMQGDEGPRRIQLWVSGQGGDPLAADAVAGSAILRLVTGDCDTPVQEIYYLGHRAGDADNPSSLFRRRQAYEQPRASVEELVEGLTDFQLVLATIIGISGADEFYYGYLDGSELTAMVDDVVIVRVQIGFGDPAAVPPFVFSVRSRRGLQVVR